MGKIRSVAIGDEKEEKAQKKKAEARRETKKAKKSADKTQDSSVGGEEGSGIKPEYQRLVDEVEQGQEGAEKPKKQSTAKAPRVRSKRYQDMLKLVDKNTLYALDDAIALMKKTSLSKFDGTVELHINLNPQSMGDKKDMRGAVSLPHGTGKEVKVVIADDTVLAEIEAGNINFDILVAHPSMMPKLAKVARTLGPKGLMPNPKNGTVSPDPEKRAKELSHGQVNFKTEPDQPIIHMVVGRVSFEEKKLTENIQAVLKAVGANKITKVTLAASMGPGIKLAIA
jgi:large subunit ribosomal protein L1